MLFFLFLKSKPSLPLSPSFVPCPYQPLPMSKEENHMPRHETRNTRSDTVRHRTEDVAAIDANHWTCHDKWLHRQRHGGPDNLKKTRPSRPKPPHATAHQMCSSLWSKRKHFPDATCRGRRFLRTLVYAVASFGRRAFRQTLRGLSRT